MLAGVGYIIGFDGVYKFSNIGESYAQNNVPYIPLRALPASLHVASVALIYNIMRETGSSVLTCFLTASLYLLGIICLFIVFILLQLLIFSSIAPQILDNAFISQHRLIMLDSMLIFYMLTTIYSYINFRKYRHA